MDVIQKTGYSGKFVELSKKNSDEAAKKIKLNELYYRCFYIGDINGSAYLFAQFEKDRNNFKDYRELVRRLNTENSTRLSNSAIDRIGKNIEKLLKNGDFDSRLKKKDYSVFNDIYADSGKIHFSFATKFCFFYSYHVFGDEKIFDSFPIFDGIMRNSLPVYAEAFGKDSGDLKVLKKYKYASYKQIDADIDLSEYYKAYLRTLEGLKPGDLTVSEKEQLLWWFHRTNVVIPKKQN